MKIRMTGLLLAMATVLLGFASCANPAAGNSTIASVTLNGRSANLEVGTVGWTPLSRHIFQKISVTDFIYQASQA
jgi:hypothetical protein